MVEKGDDRLCLTWSVLWLKKYVLGVMRKLKEKRLPGWPVAQGSGDDEAGSE